MKKSDLEFELWLEDFLVDYWGSEKANTIYDVLRGIEERKVKVNDKEKA